VSHTQVGTPKPCFCFARISSGRNFRSASFKKNINQVERWFALLTQKQIKRGSHRSTVA
jgi:hypothetical protein